MGFLVGLLLGAVAALLYAPKAGGEMRDEVRTRTDDLRRRADDMQRVAQKLKGEAQSKGKELIDDAKQEWSGSGTGSGTSTGGTTGRPGGTA